MGLYLKSGFLNFLYILRQHCKFIYIVGGRGTGKTYGVIKTLIEQGETFFFIRRTRKEYATIANEMFSPFREVAEKEFNKGIKIKSLDTFVSAVYLVDSDDSDLGAPVAFLAELYDISDVKGFVSFETKYIVYDEFIKEKNKRAYKDEHNMLTGAYETINRNRELDGYPPVQMICLANSEECDNPIFRGLNLVDICVNMQRKGQEEYVNPGAKSTAIYLLFNSEISKRKEKTALYQMLGKSSYADMAIKNQFADLKGRMFKSINPHQLEQVFAGPSFYIYRKKGSGEIYCTDKKFGVFNKEYTSKDTELIQMRRQQSAFFNAYINQKIIFETYSAETSFRHGFGL